MKQVLFYCDICGQQVREEILRSIYVNIGSEGDVAGSYSETKIEQACRNCRSNFEIAVERFLEAKGDLR